jgi:peptide/nickel transport system substrate-binding protein
MNALKIGLTALVAVLLLVLIIDRARESAPLLIIRDSVANLQRSVDTLQSTNLEQQQQLQRLQKQLSERPAQPPVATPTSGQTGTGGDASTSHVDTPAPAPVDATVQDGNPKLGVNFLLPYESSYYHPEWLGGTLFEFNESPKSLNPLIDQSKTTQDLWGLANDSLCDRPPTHPETWSQSLATSVVISDDYKVYTFTLRHGVKWQRPEIAKRPEFAWLNKDVELTADDFKFAIDLVLNPQVDCPSQRNYYDDVDHAEVIDRYTFRMVWKRKVYTSLSASLGLAPMPRHIYQFNADGTAVPPAQIGISFNQSWFDREHAMCGVGEYILSDFEPDKVIRLRRNPDYWGVGLHFENLEFPLDVKKPEPRLTAFKNGQVQVHGLTPLQYKKEILDHHEPRFAAVDPANPKAGRDGELGWERHRVLAFSYLGWNMRHPPFDDIKVRQAMSYAFPKKRIIEQVFYGLGTSVLSDVPPGSQYLNTELEPYEFDLDKARALLAEAGWKDVDGSGLLSKTIDGVSHPLKFEIKCYADSPDWDNALLIYRNELSKIGVSMTARPEEWKELMRVYEDKDFEAIVGGWATGVDMDYFQLWHSSQADVQGGSNTVGFKNPEVDALASQLRLTFDTAERIAIVKKLQAIINHEQPYTFFRSSENIFVWQNKGSPARDRYLDGVDYGLDHLSPMFNTKSLYWHFRSE